MTAFIRYITPYIVKGHGPFILLFALEHDIRLRCVLGLPTLLSIGADIYLLSGELMCTELDRTFPLTLHPPGTGLPAGATLNRYSSSIPPSVLTNITSTTSLVQYTSSDGFILSDYIFVKDQFFYSVSRELSFVHLDTPRMLLCLAREFCHVLFFCTILQTHLLT